IFERPRPLSRQRRANHLYTLICEEPDMTHPQLVRDRFVAVFQRRQHRTVACAARFVIACRSVSEWCGIGHAHRVIGNAKAQPGGEFGARIIVKAS
ncbi:hypothetical protein, partial [Mycolicibacterium canariasense]